MKKQAAPPPGLASFDSGHASPPPREGWFGPGLGFEILNGAQIQQIDFLLYELGYPDGDRARPDSGKLGLIVRNGKYCRLRPEPMPYLTACTIQRPWVQLPNLTNGDGPADGLYMLSMARARYIDRALAWVTWRWIGELRLLVLAGQHLYSYPIVEIEVAKHYKPESEA